MIEVDSQQLIGNSVEIRPLEVADIDALFAIAQYSDIWSYMPRFIDTREDMVQLVNDALQGKAAGSEFPFVIVSRETGELIGSTRFLDISEANRNLEIGWTWLTPSVWRTRVNTECKFLLLRLCFEQLGLLRVQLKTDGRNVRSQQAIARIGGVREGVLRKHRILPDGFIRDSVYFSIVDEEWPAVKARLLSMLS